MNVWVCLVRREAFVGGESQRCRHTKQCGNCGGTGEMLGHSAGKTEFLGDCPTCNGTGQVSECGEMVLIGGEPIEWCVHRSAKSHDKSQLCEWAALLVARGSFPDDPCQFESQVRVGP